MGRSRNLMSWFELQNRPVAGLPAVNSNACPFQNRHHGYWILNKGPRTSQNTITMYMEYTAG